MFYDRFSKACKEKGTTPTSVVKAVGLSTGGMAHWKKGATPKIDTLRKLADYLKVDVNDLLDDDQKEKPVEDDGLVNGDTELTEYLDELRNRSEMRILFSVTKDAKKEEIEALAKFFEQMKGKKGN